MTIPDDGGPAFPVPIVADNGGICEGDHSGMSLADWFAGRALAHYLATAPASATYHDIAEKCYRAADALVAERQKRSRP